MGLRKGQRVLVEGLLTGVVHEVHLATDTLPGIVVVDIDKPSGTTARDRFPLEYVRPETFWHFLFGRPGMFGLWGVWAAVLRYGAFLFFVAAGALGLADDWSWFIGGFGATAILAMTCFHYLNFKRWYV